MITFNDSRFKNYFDKIEQNINLIKENIGDEAEIILADNFKHLPNLDRISNFILNFDNNDVNLNILNDVDREMNENIIFANI